jgi:hypothetical protein
MLGVVVALIGSGGVLAEYFHTGTAYENAWAAFRKEAVNAPTSSRYP